MAASDYINQVQSMYIAYYGRFADQAGLNYWTYMLDANGGNLDGIIQAFGTSAEATALYPATLSTAQKVTNLYNSLFGRDPDAAGLTFYTNLIGSGQATLVDIAKRVFDGATAEDANRLANKVNLANNLTSTVGASTNYSGDAAAATARALMSNVTNDPASITPVQNVMGAAVNSAKTTGIAITTLEAATKNTTDTTTSNDITAPIASISASDNTTLSIITNEVGNAGLYDTTTEALVGARIIVPANTDITIPTNLTSVTNTQVKVRDLANNSTTIGSVIIDRTGNNNDTVTGTTGNDIFYTFGSATADTATGDTGLDTFYVNGGVLNITDLGLGGSEVVFVTSGAEVNATLGANWTATAATQNLGSQAQDFEIIAAGAFTANLSAATVTNAANDGFLVISQGTGIITGSVGNDILVNENGNTSFTGGLGADFFKAVNDIMTVTDLSGSDNFFVDGSLFAPRFNATVSGNWEASNLTRNNGGDNTKAVISVSNDFTVSLYMATVTNPLTDGFTIQSTGNGRIDGSAGNDVITATHTSSWIILNGYHGDDTITGGDAVDYISGQDGNDIIIGGKGVDSLMGGAGYDRFVFATGDAATTTKTDSISDFYPGDMIDLRAVIGSGTLALITTGTATALNGTGIADTTTVDFDAFFAVVDGQTYLVYETAAGNGTTQGATEVVNVNILTGTLANYTDTDGIITVFW